MKLVNYLDEQTWRDFVVHQPQGNIFHTPEIFKVFERARGHHPQLYAAISDEGRVLALFLPVQVSLMNGLLRRLTTRSISYGSVLYSTDPSGESALNTLLCSYSKSASRESLFTELRNLSDLGPIQPVLSNNGFVYEDHLDYLIDLNCSPGNVLQNIGARTRKHIRQAMRRGVVITEEFCDSELLPLWYELIRKSYATARVPLADRSLFEAAFEILRPRGMAQFWLARIDSTFVAASAELLYKDVIYGWYSGVDRAYASENPGELLMWRVLEQGAMVGYKTYDFGGAGRPDEKYSVRDFKAKFGGQLVCYGRNTKLHSPKLLRWSETGYRIYRHLLRYF